MILQSARRRAASLLFTTMLLSFGCGVSPSSQLFSSQDETTAAEAKTGPVDADECSACDGGACESTNGTETAKYALVPGVVEWLLLRAARGATIDALTLIVERCGISIRLEVLAGLHEHWEYLKNNPATALRYYRDFETNRRYANRRSFENAQAWLIDRVHDIIVAFNARGSLQHIPIIHPSRGQWLALQFDALHERIFDAERTHNTLGLFAYERQFGTVAPEFFTRMIRQDPLPAINSRPPWVTYVTLPIGRGVLE